MKVSRIQALTMCNCVHIKSSAIQSVQHPHPTKVLPFCLISKTRAVILAKGSSSIGVVRWGHMARPNICASRAGILISSDVAGYEFTNGTFAAVTIPLYGAYWEENMGDMQGV